MVSVGLTLICIWMQPDTHSHTCAHSCSQICTTPTHMWTFYHVTAAQPVARDVQREKPATTNFSLSINVFFLLPVLSELHRIVSFPLVPGPCLIHIEITKGSFMLIVTTWSGTFTAWVPLNSKTWSLSWPLSVGRPAVQFAVSLGEGSSSAVSEEAPANWLSYLIITTTTTKTC